MSDDLHSMFSLGGKCEMTEEQIAALRARNAARRKAAAEAYAAKLKQQEQ